MISTVFALALAASAAPDAGACTLLNLAACRDAGQLVRDPSFQSALRQFVGVRRTGYLTASGQAYGEAMTVLGGPAEPVPRLRNLYIFTACADASCDDQGVVALHPDGELAAVAILHSDCVGLRRVGDCASREILSVMRRQDDDLGLIETLADQARRSLAARPIYSSIAARVLDRVEVILLDGAASQQQATQTAPAPPPAAPPPPVVATVQPRPTPAPSPVAATKPPVVAETRPPAPITLNIPPPAPAPPAPLELARKPQPVLVAPSEVRTTAPPQAQIAPPTAPKVEVTEAPGPPGPVSGVTAAVRPRVAFIPIPRQRYLTLIAMRPVVEIVPPPPPPPPRPKRNDGWQFHWTPYDCSDPTPQQGEVALGPLTRDVKSKNCKAWKR